MNSDTESEGTLTEDLVGFSDTSDREIAGLSTAPEHDSSETAVQSSTAAADPAVHSEDSSRRYIEEDVTISGKSYPARPSTIQFVQIPRSHTDHTYRDFSEMAIEEGYTFPVDIEQMTFHEKLYHLLTYTSVQCRQSIDWCCNGRAFEIKSTEGLEQLGMLRCYFGFNGIQRFRKQLNNYGYKLLTRFTTHERYYSEVSFTDFCCFLYLTLADEKVPLVGTASRTPICPTFHKSAETSARSTERTKLHPDIDVVPITW